ncbi:MULTISPECIES: alpha-hydroxy acid oxidase [unclassified Sphingomonas]|uniref:alpha-hydroxy acid oxidase n=1 Tax=unclassified Sphingomonas TaxID=196159 RepID=UPI0006F28281|nr:MULTISPECIES: alpha-hydroxy acid oxidase [unclassified Sphingomonas]KQX23445.1 alpha-hydroxy-acid oxidizing enzyme [Sphingomonas sp. Root1294]KQY68296.1 alpha-hydroxy-acid oxidizing enzyme [Sphingomonas sp. Root50]KRB91196.1 alpha-hydroxy-acid oxidizing enzyme [Sphingomonas sp. Root720]
MALLDALCRRRLRAAHSIDDLRDAARRTLPRMVFDYVDGGAQSESTMRQNRAAFERHRLLSAAPVDVSRRSTATTLFGQSLAMPLIIGPTGYASAFWPKGDLALARGAAAAGVPFVVSNGANSRLRDIAEASGGQAWLQLYIAHDKQSTLGLIGEARALGFETLEVTVDTALPGRRIRDIRNGFTVPYSWTPDKVVDVLRHPGWMLRALPHGAPRPGLMPMEQGRSWATVSEFVRSQINPAIGWDDLAWLRDQWPGTLIVKGLLDPGQVEPAIAAGYDGIVISNHGGRQLDGAVSTLDVLPDFAAAAKQRIPLLIDSGVRTGTDILKAVALGASAVQVGRATLYGLSTAGEAGVGHALGIFRTELDMAMALVGLNRVADATPAIVRTIA